LSVFDPEPPITGTILALHAFEDIELLPDGAIAYGVHHQLESRAVGSARPGVEVLGSIDEESRVAGTVGERLQHGGGVGAQRPVRETFQATDVHPLVTVAARIDRVAEPLPTGEWHGSMDTGDQPAGLPRSPEDGQFPPRPHVVHGGDALCSDILH